jgi:hypothetical protein
MDGIWIKHCPMCGEYLQKAEPEETGRCAACGWQEYMIPYYCPFRHRFCSEEDDGQALSDLLNGTTLR